MAAASGAGVPAPGGRDPARGGAQHPAVFGPGIEENTHKIGECVDQRELAPAIAFYARFPSLYRAGR